MRRQFTSKLWQTRVATRSTPDSWTSSAVECNDLVLTANLAPDRRVRQNQRHSHSRRDPSPDRLHHPPIPGQPKSRPRPSRKGAIVPPWPCCQLRRIHTTLQMGLGNRNTAGGYIPPRRRPALRRIWSLLPPTTSALKRSILNRIHVSAPARAVFLDPRLRHDAKIAVGAGTLCSWYWCSWP